MHTVTVYRVEDHLGQGPYQGAALGYAYIHGHDADYTRHPTPDEDSIGDPWGLKHMHYGFQSKRLAVKWFPKAARRRLYLSGFHLSVYEVPEDHVIPGDHQCVFNMKHAVATRVVPLARVKKKLEVSQ